MKIGLFHKSIIKKFGIIVSFVSTTVSFVLIFFDFPDDTTNDDRLLCFLIFILILVFVYLIIWILANKMTKTAITLGLTTIEIKAGDIFEQDGLKAIAFNEYFDTIVDNRIISKASLNGQVIEKYFPDVNILNNIISSDKDLNTSENILKKYVNREGNTVKYRLGSSILVNDEFVFTAFSKFTKKNEAELTMQEYINFLLTFWNEINRLYAQRSVLVPIFGAGITRFKNGYDDIDINELLKIMIWTFEVSKIKFAFPAKLTIVIYKDLISKVNLFGIKEND